MQRRLAERLRHRSPAYAKVGDRARTQRVKSEICGHLWYSSLLLVRVICKGRISELIFGYRLICKCRYPNFFICKSWIPNPMQRWHMLSCLYIIYAERFSGCKCQSSKPSFGQIQNDPLF